jgi:threonine aldolase
MIDFRSDTVTKPTAAMRAAMAAADVGDDVYGEDPTVNELERYSAELLDKEAAIFVCSGTQSNLLAVMAHCERGDEYIVGQEAHAYKYEGGGAAVLGSVHPQPLHCRPDGTLDLEEVAAHIKPDDSHFARTRLLCLENTIHGKVLPLAYLATTHDFAREHGLALHLDGARLFNAVIDLGVPVHTIARHFDTVSVCLSKGLGAPVGSVLVGARTHIDKARRWRKVLGGGMRQAGVLAAGALYALRHHVDRLRDDHTNARVLAEGLREVGWQHVDGSHTNMVFLHLSAGEALTMPVVLRHEGILVAGGTKLRLVTHLDVRRDHVRALVAAAGRFRADRQASAS